MILQKAISLLALSATLVSGALYEAAPHQNVEGEIFLINRENMIAKQYVPPVEFAEVSGYYRDMRPDAVAALEAMYAAAEEETGLTFTAVSGYRSYSKQSTIYQNKIEKVGSKAKANNYVAPPGASEHQLGLAMDVGAKGVNVGLNAKFGETEAGIWLAENAHRFGFIIRYQEGWEEITGYKYEPWHVRYVGTTHAAALYEQAIPLETYIEAYRVSHLLEVLSRGNE